MRLYLSSYRIGNHADQLKELVGKPHARVAVSVNALDFSTNLPRVAKDWPTRLVGWNCLDL